MSQRTEKRSWALAIAQNHTLIPGFLLFLAAIGFFLYYGQAPGTSRYLWGKQVLVPYANLGLLFYVIGALAIPALIENLKHRYVAIKEGVADFSERNDEIAQRYRDYEEKLTQVDTVTAEFLKRAEEQAEAERAEIAERAKAQAERIERDAHQEGDQELKKMQQDLQAEMLEAAFVKAEERIKTQMTPSIKQQMQDSYIQDLGASL